MRWRKPATVPVGEEILKKEMILKRPQKETRVQGQRIIPVTGD